MNLTSVYLGAQVAWSAAVSYHAVNGLYTLPAWELIGVPTQEFNKDLAVRVGFGSIKSGEELHALYLGAKLATGWVYAPAFDPILKTSPEVTPWAALEAIYKCKWDIAYSIGAAYKSY